MTEKRLIDAVSKVRINIKKNNWTRRTTIIAAGIAVAFLCILFIWNKWNGSDAEVITVEQQDYSERIVAVGQLQLASETTLIAEVSGEVMSIGAEEGDIISADSIILSIDGSEQIFQLEQKKASYENAKAEYQQLIEFDYASAKEELVSHTVKKEQTKISYDAAVRLYQEGALSQVEYLAYKSDYEAALASWNTAKLKVESLSEGGALRSASSAQLLSAQSFYESALNDQKKYQITVPWKSVLLKTYVREHDFVQPGDPLADIGEAGSYHVITELDEKYFPYLSEGMHARITLGDNGTGDDAEGTVDVISRKINEETGTFEVKIALPEAYPYQASNLTVNVEIIILESKNAIVIPEDYLLEGESAVYLYQDRKAVKTKVEYQAGSSSKLLITKGLKDGDTIVKPGASVQEGKTVSLGKGVEEN